MSIYKKVWRKEFIERAFSTERLLWLAEKENFDDYELFFNNERVQLVFFDDELMLSIEMFLENDLNFCKAARAMFIHRNTMVYRINRIKKFMGLDLRTYGDARLFDNMIKVFRYYGFYRT